ncbi:hypothetical protein [Arthrobacter sp. PM3]|nr:hypothetical protein [Arthrobacter sp. PM3]
MLSLAAGFFSSGLRGNRAAASAGSAQGSFIEEITKRGELHAS